MTAHVGSQSDDSESGQASPANVVAPLSSQVIPSEATLRRGRQLSSQSSSNDGLSRLPPIVPENEPNATRHLTDSSFFPDDVRVDTSLRSSVRVPSYVSSSTISGQVLREDMVDHDYEPPVNGAVVEPHIGELRFLPGTNEDTMLLDLQADEMGALLGIGSSVTFIPEKYLKKVRAIWIRYMQKALDDGQITDWKKYFLLPTIVFDNLGSPSTKAMKDNMADRLRLLEADSWESFTLGTFSQYKPHITLDTSVEEHTNYVHKRCLKLVEQGLVGKAAKTLNREFQPLPTPEETFIKLLEKFPPGQSSISRNEWIDLLTCRVPDDTPKIDVSVDTITDIIYRLDRHVRPGTDKIRNEHLKALCGPPNSSDPNEAEFRRVYTAVINRIINAELPDEVQYMYRDIDCFAVPKGNLDVRPIGANILDRKIASTAFLRSIRDFNRSHFEGLQCATENLGMEKIIHSFRVASEQFPDKDIFSMDGKNAHNILDRGIMMREILKHHPAILPFVRMIYGQNSKAWFIGQANGINFIDSSLGLHQGDVLASWLYSMGTLPFVQQISALLNDIPNDDFVKFYFDDGTICADFDKMVKAIQLILRVGPSFGYRLNLKKGCYLMARCGRQEYLRRRHVLVNLGLSPDIIRPHPADTVLTDVIVNDQYGFDLLGSFIGSDDYIRCQLDKKLEVLRREADMLIALPHLQSRALILRMSFSLKINHLLRSTYPSLVNNLTSEFELLKLRVLSSIVPSAGAPDNMRDWFKTQVAFRVTEGGLGLGNTEETYVASYAASIAECFRFVNKTIPSFSLRACDTRQYEEVQHCLRVISAWDPEQPLLTCEDLLNIVASKKSGQTVQGILTDSFHKHSVGQFIEALKRNAKHLAWFISLKDSSAGQWLLNAPKSDSFRFSDEEFRIALCRRFRLPQHDIITGSRCSCKHKPLLDCFGDHLVTGCGRDGCRKDTHNAVVLCVKDLASVAGIKARLEEQHCFREAFPDNGLKGDLSLWNVPDAVFPKTVCDATITHVAPGSMGTRDIGLSVADALRPGRAAKKSMDQKNRKYSAISAANNLEFQPLVFETTGRIESGTMCFLKRLISRMAHGDDRLLSIYTSYWMSRISCCLQKYMARAIICRSTIINGAFTSVTNYDLMDRFIIDNHNIH
jgi:hypothetical protein